MTELMCLVAAIFFEARSEPVDAQLAIADVVINRVEDSRYPDTVCDVVFEDKQFSFTHDGKSDDVYKYNTHFDKQAREQIIELAKYAMERETEITSTHYIRVDAKAMWQDAFAFDGKVGEHFFYTNETPWR